eukprot:7430202-Karenia_brevis.AAC.1
MVLSRSSPDEDGLWKYCMKIDSIQGQNLVVLEPRRKPWDVTMGMWRLDFVEDYNARSRLLANLRQFTGDQCHSKVVQQLIANEPDHGE